VSPEELEEELPQPPRRGERPRAQRLRRDIAVGFGGLALVTLVGLAVANRGADTGPGAGRSTSPARSAPSTERLLPTDFVTVRPVDGGWIPVGPPLSHALTRCPRAGTCLLLPGVAQGVRDAVLAAFPGATITSARRVQLIVENYGDALMGFDVDAQRGNERILVRLRGGASPNSDRTTEDVAGSMIIGGLRIMRYEAPLVQYSVVVEVIAPASEQHAVRPLVRLAHDVRLLDRY
jgi:hypothetical protein